MCRSFISRGILEALSASPKSLLMRYASSQDETVYLSSCCHQRQLSAGMALPSMRPLISSPLHRIVQLASQQRQHHNSAIFTAHSELLALAILTAQISRLAAFVAAELRNVACYSSRAARRFMLHSTCSRQAAAVDSCPDACLLFCATSCMLLDGGKKVDAY